MATGGYDRALSGKISYSSFVIFLSSNTSQSSLPMVTSSKSNMRSRQ